MTHWPSGIESSRHEFMRCLPTPCRLVEMPDRNAMHSLVRVTNVEGPGIVHPRPDTGGGGHIILSRRTQLQARRAKNLFTVSLAILQSFNT